MLKKWVWMSFLVCLFALSACHPPTFNQAQGNVADIKIKTNEEIKKSDELEKPQPSLLIKDGLYVDTTPINLDKEPSWLKNHVIIRGDQLPFSYYTRLIASGGNSNALVKYQPGLDTATKLSFNYSGTVKGALDLLAAKMGYTYTVEKSTIYWQAFITKTFDIAFMPGDSDYLMGKKSGSSSRGNSGASDYVSSDSSEAEYSNLSGKVSIWKDLTETVNQLRSPEGKVTVSQASTSITVKDRPANVELIASYIKNFNQTLSKQVLVKIQVLEVILEDDFDFGINWQIVAKAINRSTSFRLTGDYSTPISLRSLGSMPSGPDASTAHMTFGATKNGNSVLFNALNQQGKTSVVSEPRVVCLNNQVSVIRIVDQKGYVASVQSTINTAGGGVGQNTVTSQITPGTLITGLTLYILPKILNENVYLQVNADLSTDNGFSESTAGTPGKDSNLPNSQIMLPNITEKHFNQRSMIRSGDTLILSGFRQKRNVANAMQFLNSQSLGGKGSQQLNRETIVLITPIVLNGSV